MLLLRAGIAPVGDVAGERHCGAAERARTPKLWATHAPPAGGAGASSDDDMRNLTQATDTGGRSTLRCRRDPERFSCNEAVAPRGVICR